jgi:hypothetical protein
MKRIAILAALFAAACGGGGGGGTKTNAAASKTFTYGAAQTGYVPPAGATSALSGALTASTASTGTDAVSAPTGLMAAANAALSTGGSNLPVSATARVQSLLGGARTTALTGSADLPSGVFSPACATVVPGSATFTGCTYKDVYGGTTTIFTLNGSVTAVPGSMDWNLTVTISESTAATATAPATGFDASYASAGHFTATATTAMAHDDSEIHVSLTNGTQSFAAAVAQTADLDVTYTPVASCSTRITGGTFEAKRVWLTRPTGATATDLPDAGVKYTWTGCGTANVQFSVN